MPLDPDYVPPLPDEDDVPLDAAPVEPEEDSPKNDEVPEP